MRIYRRRTRCFAHAALSALAVAVFGLTLDAAPVQAARRVIIVSIDGLRPDVAMRADMPGLRSLMARGSFTFFASTTDTAVTLPSHTSMLTGVTPAKHGILYNSDPLPGQRGRPLWPTLFELAHRAGLRTALCAGKSKFSVLAQPGAVDMKFVPGRGRGATDSAVAVAAVEFLASGRPQLMFVHFAGPDVAGHERGWGSAEQLVAIERSDQALRRVLAGLAGGAPADSTLIIVSADHGGAGLTHGGLDASSHFIPWIVAGPGVRRDFDLSQDRELRVHTEDTFATASAWLRVRIVKPVDGRAVTEIFERPLSK